MIFFTIFLFGLDIGKLSDINVDFVVWLFAINVDFDYLIWCCLTEVKESIGEGMRLRCMQFLKPTCRTWMKEDRNCQYPGPNFLKIAKSERDSSSLLTLLQSFDNNSNPIQFLFGKTVWIQKKLIYHENLIEILIVALFHCSWFPALIGGNSSCCSFYH